MRTIGIIMAKKGSVRVPDKNIRNVCGKPMMAYAIRSMLESKACDDIIVATNSVDYGKIGVDLGADDYVIRCPSTDKFRFFSVSAQDALTRYTHKTQKSYDAAVIVGANCMFLRSSWIRTALTLIRNFAYDTMPIEVVSIEKNQWTVNACRVQSGIVQSLNYFCLRHSGMFLEVDWEHELVIACELQAQVNAGTISYPVVECVHEEILARMSEAPNHLSGLTRLSELQSTNTI